MSLQANVVLDRCASTNDLARELGEAGYPHGTWVSARAQSGGRGRLGRKWESLEGNLFLSIVLRVETRAVWTWVPLAGAVAVAAELRRMNPSLDVRVKWPNDLWLGGAKVGGILCEAVGNRAGSFIVFGIGLNCATAPEGLDQETAALGLDVDLVRPRVVEAIVGAADGLLREGPRATMEEYGKLAALVRGTLIEWGEDKIGLVEGLGESGELLVKTAGGESQRLYAEDVKVRIRKS